MTPDEEDSHAYEVEPLVQLLHNIDLPFAVGKPPPSEFRIFSAGKIETTKGSFLFDAKAADLVMASAAEYGNDYAVDYDHGMGAFLAMDPAESGKAAGWFKPEMRNGELWATSVSWTPKATEKLSAREYRYTSPAFRTEKEGGRIAELVNVALTNLPATRKHTPLMASRAGDPGMESKMKTIAVALSLAAEATEAEVLAAVTTLKSFAADVLAATGAKSMQEVHGILIGLKANEGKLLEQATKLAAFEAREKDTAIAALIAEGEKVGKITPSTKALVLGLAQKHGIEALKGFLDAAQAAPKPLTEPEHQGNAELTPEELAMCARTKLDPKVVIASKKAALAAGTYPTA